MGDSLLTNYKSPYLNSLASDFDRKTQSREGFVLPVNIVDSFQKPVDASKDNFQKKEKKINWGYLAGMTSTVGQIIAGTCMMGAVILEKKGKVSQNLINNLKHIGGISLGASFLVGIPSYVGGGLTLKQPGMILGALAWAPAAILMMTKKYQDSVRLKGYLMVGYVLNYLGLANDIKNGNELKKGEARRECDLKNSKDNLFTKAAKSIKFSLEDNLSLPAAVKRAYQQTKDYISRKRKEIPDFLSTDPNSDNRKVLSAFLYAGGIPLMIFGNKNKMIEKFANVMIGTGLLLDTIGIMAIGRKEKGASKAILIGGAPLRAVGDFNRSNNFMYGLRTLGGAAFEYYFANLNKKEEVKKAKANS
jgi:hypothetical protein